ncbi:MAG: parallel beta-helix domain-containing protein [Pirellulales bacterium]
MHRCVFLLAAMWAVCVVATALGAEGDAPPSISGWSQRGGAWLPDEPYTEGQPRATSLQQPFPKMRSLDSNPMTPEKVALGKLLFFDPIVSGENTISCAHCHHPDFGFADGRKLSMGFGGKGVGPDRSGGHELGRSAPSLWNAAYQKWQFWDGRADDLEDQAAGPITNEHEMGEKPENLEKELRAIPEYVELFQKAFGGGSAESAVTFPNVTRAIAAFERTLLSFNSKYDRYAAGDTTALDEHERNGFKLFRSLKTRCFECHNFPTFADDSFRVIGVPDNGPHDQGRAAVPGEGPDGAFKTTTLRNIEHTAPYMHNGAFNTLEEVIKFYAKGGGRGEPKPPQGMDDKIGKFDITDAEVADLVAFLKALSDTSLQPDPPARVPSGLPVVAVKTKASPAPAQLAAARAAAPTIESAAAAPAPLPAASAPTNRATAPAAAAQSRPAEPLGGYSDGNLRRPADPTAARLAAAGSTKVGAWSHASSVAATFRVRPGQTIQSAVDRCRPGDRVEIEPGVYRESVVVDTDGITLAGLERAGERPTLDGGGTLADAVQGSASDLTVEGLAIRNYVGNGIMVNKAQRVTFRNLVIANSGLYGVYPVECTGVMVEGCTVSGIRDAAIYVGSSREIVVRNNEVFNNVAGIEIENCTQAVVSNNSAHHNSTGILVFVLPNNPSKEGSDTRVINNRVWANNHPNFGQPGTIVANLPPGVGILVMAADRTEVTQNHVAENNSYGIAVLSLESARLPTKHKLDVEPHSDGTLVTANEYLGNGRQAHPLFVLLGAPGGDLLWDGTGQGNTWRESGKLTVYPKDLLGPSGPVTKAINPSPTAGGSK